MSTIARPLDPAAAAGTTPAPRTGARLLALAGSAGLAAGLGAFALLASSDHLVHPLGYGLLVANVVLSSTAAGIVWLVRRPASRVGVLLLLLAASASVVGLQGVSSPVLHSVGVLFDAVLFLVAYWAVFAFPHGRLEGPVDRLLLLAPTVVVVISFVPWFLFSPVVAGGAPLARCTAACPENGLLIADRPGIAAGVGRAEDVLAVVVAAFIAAVLVYRIVAATRPRRRALLPVYVPALLLTIPFGVYRLPAFGASFDAETMRRIGWFLTAGRSTLAYGFLLSLVLAALFADGALKTIVRRVRHTPHPAHLQAVIAAALDDRALLLAFRGPAKDEFVGVDGEPIAVRDVAPGLSASPVRREGSTVAYIVHDAALDADPELVEAAGDAMLLALESGRLERELRETIADLRASRDRLAAARDTERRRIERDLHDGAQQHLFALGLKAELAAKKVAAENPALARELYQMGAALDEVVDELRNLAQAIAPPALADFGLEGALRIVAQRATPPARYSPGGIGRYPEGIETAVYFCCVEAVQNVARHGGAGARASISVWEGPGSIWFEVTDDGEGFRPDGDARRRGNGLKGMADRVEALGGTLTVDSAPGRGTRVRGAMPASPADRVA